jgi:hypothetical protein
VRRSEISRSELLTGALARVDANWNELPGTSEARRSSPTGRFGLPVTQTQWRKRAARIAHRLLTLHQASPGLDWCDDPYVMHLPASA